MAAARFSDLMSIVILCSSV